MNEISWREPVWLLVASVPWLFLLLGYLSGFLQRHTYADEKLLPWVKARQGNSMQVKHSIRFLFLAMAWLCFAIVLAGPRSPAAIYDTAEESYTRVMLVVDVSRSMTARDIAPNRLERAKLELVDLINRSQHISYGIVVFAARAHLLVPPTSDKTVLKYYLNMLRPELLPTEGSNLQAALSMASEALGSPSTAALLLVSDGGMWSERESDRVKLDQTLFEINRKGIHLYALGVGSVAGSSILDKKHGWLKDNDQIVITKLDVDLLAKISLLGKGKFAEVSDTDSEWRALYHDGIALLGMQVSNVKSDAIIEWTEHYQIWLLLAILLYVLAHGKIFLHKDREKILALLLSISVTGMIFPADSVAVESVAIESFAIAQADIRSAYMAYDKKNYAQAQKLYAVIVGYQGRMGEGDSAYQLQQYDIAAQSFILATLAASDDAQRSTALFNLANSYFRAGNYAEAESIYEDVLRYQPVHQAALLNLKYARELKKQKQKNVEQVIATRAGRGPRSARAADNLDLSQGGISLGDSDGDVKDFLPDLDGDWNKNLVAGKQIENVESSSRKSEEFDDAQWQYEITDTNSLNLYISRLVTDESVFWQRLFEGEEGFVAPVEEPHVVPGAKPW